MYSGGYKRTASKFWFFWIIERCIQELGTTTKQVVCSFSKTPAYLLVLVGLLFDPNNGEMFLYIVSWLSPDSRTSQVFLRQIQTE
jgi:hypothetical protein